MIAPKNNASRVSRLALFATIGVTLALVATPVESQQRSVTVQPGSIAATKGNQSVVVESTLSGVGVMLSGTRDARSGRVKVEFDPDTSLYIVRANGKAQIEMDARTGRYNILTSGTRGADVEIRNSLSGAGAVIRARSGGGLVELSSVQLGAMRQSMRHHGLEDAEIELQLNRLKGVGEQVERDVERAMGNVEAALEGVERTLEGSSRNRDHHATSTPHPKSTGATSALYCTGNQELVVEHRTIESDGPALVVEGNCDVFISDSTLVSMQGAAVVVRGNGEVVIEDSRLEGAIAALEYSGNSEIDARNSQFSGKVVNRGGSADFRDLGGNLFR